MLKTKFAARRRGFTLIELLIVIVVIAILALIVIPKLLGAGRKAKDATLRANLHIIRNGIAQYEADLGEYPVGTTAAALNVLWDKTQLDATPQKEAMWRGPYGTATSGGIDGTTCPLPPNPYVSSSDITKHWTYKGTAVDTDTPSTFTIEPGSTGFNVDADGKSYDTY